jgi:hypothetical protein
MRVLFSLALLGSALEAKQFDHPAIRLWDKRQRVIYTAYSKHNFYARMWISKYVLDSNFLPLNPFMVFDFGLMGRVDIDEVRLGNNTMIRLADEVWVFGVISDGVLAEIMLAERLKKPVRYFSIQPNSSSKNLIQPAKDVAFEPGLDQYRSNLTALSSQVLK